MIELTGASWYGSKPGCLSQLAARLCDPVVIVQLQDSQEQNRRGTSRTGKPIVRWGRKAKGLLSAAGPTSKDGSTSKSVRRWPGCRRIFPRQPVCFPGPGRACGSPGSDEPQAKPSSVFVRYPPVLHHLSHVGRVAMRACPVCPTDQGATELLSFPNSTGSNDLHSVQRPHPRTAADGVSNATEGTG